MWDIIIIGFIIVSVGYGINDLPEPGRSKIIGFIVGLVAGWYLSNKSEINTFFKKLWKEIIVDYLLKGLKSYYEKRNSR